MSATDPLAEARIISEQANVIPRANGKTPKDRHRASIACGPCREKRVKCVLHQGEGECENCKKYNFQCVIRYDDERRRPISRVYVNALLDRISLLEGMLKRYGVTPPAAILPDKYRTGGNANDTFDKPLAAIGAGSTDEHGAQMSHEQVGRGQHLEHEIVRSGSEDTTSVSTGDVGVSLVDKLLSSKGQFRFDQLNGSFRYFGPTTNCHIYSEILLSESKNGQSMEHDKQVDQLLHSIAPDTQQYLLGLYFQNYNAVLHVVHEDAFNEDKEAGRTRFYSKYLHLSILAMGFRFCDRNRHDMTQFAISDNNRASRLSLRLKQLLDGELEKPAGLPLIQALLLLGDCECGAGRDSIGWIYSGIANRLCFEVGLHLEYRTADTSEQEIQVRHMVLWACIIYDKYWSLFLGRPTNMKSSDLEVYHLSTQFERLGPFLAGGPSKSLETQIYEALLDLMEIAGKIAELDLRSFKGSPRSVDDEAHQHMSTLDRQLNAWYSQLSEPLKWKPENMNTAPSSFFLMHQQYHSTMILLHRPFALYADPQGPASQREQETKVSINARRTSTRHAIQIARIFWQHRQKCDPKRFFVTAMQHAGTAAVALICALATIHTPANRDSNMEYLELLHSSLQDMSYIYQPAEKMSEVLRTAMQDLRARSGAAIAFKQARSMIPSRRSSTVHDEEVKPPPKRQASYTPQISPTPMAGTSSLQAQGMYSLQTYPTPAPNPSHTTTANADSAYVLASPSEDLWPALSAGVSYLDHPISGTRNLSTQMQSGWMEMQSFAQVQSDQMSQQQQQYQEAMMNPMSHPHHQQPDSAETAARHPPMQFYDPWRESSGLQYTAVSTAQTTQPEGQPGFASHPGPLRNPSLYHPSPHPAHGSNSSTPIPQSQQPPQQTPPDHMQMSRQKGGFSEMSATPASSMARGYNAFWSTPGPSQSNQQHQQQQQQQQQQK